MPRRSFAVALVILALAGPAVAGGRLRDWRLISQTREADGVEVSLYADAGSLSPFKRGEVDAVVATPTRDGGRIYALSAFVFDCAPGADGYQIRRIRVLDPKGALLQTLPDTADRIRPGEPEAALADFACRGRGFPAADRPGFPFR